MSGISNLKNMEHGNKFKIETKICSCRLYTNLCLIPENHGMLKLVLKTASILESTSLGKILSQIEGTSIQEVIRCYIKDFVHMAYPVKSEPEQLVR